MAKEDEKLDIDDIKDPLDQLEDEEELDLEEAVSEEEATKKEAEEAQEPKKEPEEVVEVEEEKLLDETPGKKEKKSLFKKKPKKDKVPAAAVLKPVKPKKKKVLGTVIVILFTALITAAAVLGAVWYLNKDNKTQEANEEVVATEEEIEESPQVTQDFVYVSSEVGINLRKEPNTTSEILAIIPNGTKLEILDEDAGWYKVEYQNKEGWVSKEFVTKDNPSEYTNADYGFTLTFPGDWAGHKAVKKSVEGSTATYYFGLTTTDKTWTDSSEESGFASFFAISVYTTAQWEAIQSEGGIAPTKLGESGGYVFGWSQAQATPTDLSSKFGDVKEIIETFKIK